MQVLPRRKTQVAAPSSGANGNGNGKNGNDNGKRVAADGTRLVERDPDHSLPVFDPGVELRDSMWEAATPSETTPAPTRYLGHSLPLFGPEALSHALVTVGADGHPKANSNGKGH
jgi:RND superfamily putative drug exporter